MIHELPSHHEFSTESKDLRLEGCLQLLHALHWGSLEPTLRHGTLLKRMVGDGLPWIMIIPCISRSTSISIYHICVYIYIYMCIYIYIYIHMHWFKWAHWVWRNMTNSTYWEPRLTDGWMPDYTIPWITETSSFCWANMQKQKVPKYPRFPQGLPEGFTRQPKKTMARPQDQLLSMLSPGRYMLFLWDPLMNSPNTILLIHAKPEK